jgi:transcriptional regulator with XRE-family HTH domain
MSVTIAQIRAARGLLNWTQDDLAHHAAVSVATIRKLELGKHTGRAHTLGLIRSTFERFGIEFLGEQGLQATENIFRVSVFEGRDSISKILDDIYDTLAPTKGELLLSGLSEVQWEEDYGTELNEQVKKRIKSGIRQRFLICEGDQNFRAAPEFYRWVPEWLFAQTPYYVYANKLALISWDPPRKIVLIENKSIAETFRKQFNYNWQMGQVVSQAKPSKKNPK